MFASGYDGVILLLSLFDCVSQVSHKGGQLPNHGMEIVILSDNLKLFAAFKTYLY